jgi:NitT/TauT family transport system substrate-binding protein
MNSRAKLALAGGIVVIVAVAAIASASLLAPKRTTNTSSTGSETSNTTCCSTNLLRIGYFANLNHAQALVGLFNGDYQKALGSTVQIQSTLFNAGPTEMTALLAGKLDMAYVGPSPAVNAFIQSNGTGLRIVAGASNGGAFFVVTNASGIGVASNGAVARQLAHKSFLGPQLGNTQDVALRAYLLRNHLIPGMNVTVQDTSNANIITQMVENRTDGAWVPQPYATLILSKAKAHIFLDERSLWPGGNFSTAELVASTPFLLAHADVVLRIVIAHVNETLWINSHLSQASKAMNNTLSSQTGLGLGQNAISGSLATLSFTYDPLVTSVREQAQQAFELGFLGTSPPSLSGLFDLSILNEGLQQLGLPAVSS